MNESSCDNHTGTKIFGDEESNGRYAHSLGTGSCNGK